MPTHDFHGLSDADFEELVADLLRAALGVPFQIFTAGPDDGIDLLHGSNAATGVVVQCKHFLRSGFQKLNSTFANKELPKIAKVNPARYIIATSVPLTPANKQVLLKTVSPYCRGLDDIYGRDDLNSLLRTHPGVETAHYKLWLTSVAVLQRIVRQGGVVWNSLIKDDIERRLSIFVQTPAYGIAMKILKEHNYCVISGIPGIGKTTLAQVLVTRLLEDGFELIAVRDDIKEAFEMLNPHSRQVVYYDDFLGRSSLGERLGKNEDASIIRLLNEAKRSKNIKVILTTREYILNDARRIYEPLSGPELEVAKCIVKIDDYTRGHRARILYNHICFSELSNEYAIALFHNRAYKQIVDHKNYNPRVVEWMTGAYVVSEPEKFVAEFVAMLDNPLRIWAHAFDNQIGRDAQHILFCLASTMGPMALDELYTAWVSTLGIAHSAMETRDYRFRFNSALKNIDGSFIRTERANHETGISFHNPSIRDYVARRLTGDKDMRDYFLSCAKYFEQVDCLVRLDENGHVEYEPTGRVADCAILRDATKRVIATLPSVLHTERSKRGDIKLWKSQLDIGSRLSKLSRWADHLGANWLEFICEIAKEQLETGDPAKVATTDACGFVGLVNERLVPVTGKWLTLVKRFVEEIGNALLADGNAASEWSEWSWFIRRNKSLFPEETLEKWSEEVYTFCIDEVDVICLNAGSASEAENWFDDIKSAAEAWGFSIEEEQKKLERWIEEKKSSWESDEDWDGERIAGSGSDPQSTDRELDRLFGSLAARVR